MPDINGIEVCQRIKSDPELEGILVVIVSGKWTSADHQNLGLRTGADGYITRPIERNDFLARIEAFVRIARAEKKLREANRDLELLVQVRTTELSEALAQLREETAKRGKAEEVAEEINALNLATLDSLEAQIAVIGTDGVILATNQAWQRFARGNSGDFENLFGNGANYLEVCRRAARGGDVVAQQAIDGITEVQRSSKASFELEYPCHAPLEERWFSLRVTPLGDASGRVVIAHVNITKIKQAEESLRNREAIYSGIVNQAVDSIALVDPATGRLIEFNEAACRNLGYTRGEFALLGIQDFNAQWSPEEIAQELITLQARGTHIFETRHRHKDGEILDRRVSTTTGVK